MKLPLLSATLATLIALPAALAQTTTLVTLNPNQTGEQISAQIVQGPDGTLYGVSRQGGANGNGFVFKVQPDGSGYQSVFPFPSGTTVARLPEYSFILGRDGVLYGTTEFGGTATFGTIYKVNTDGTGFAVLRSFTAGGTAVVADGGAPRGGLVHASDGFLYGLTTTGTAASTNAADRNGVIYRIATDGSGYRIIFSFDGGSSATNGQLPNALIQGRDGNLYGTTRAGGPLGAGTVFKIRTDGTGFTILQRFALGTAAATTGAAPDSDLVQAGDGYLYGTTIGGGPPGDGTLYRLLPDGSAFEIVHAFNRAITIRGGRPRGAFFQGSDGYLYGRTEDGGAVANGGGIIFRVRTDGTSFQTLQSVGFGFPGRLALMQGRDGNLYGAGLNTQFLRIIPPLPLAITEQPRSQTVAPGSNVTFSVTARGATRYQWFRNGATIAGATNATYTLNNVTTAANATYSVLAHNSPFADISVNAVLGRNAEADLSNGAILLVAAPNPGRLINLSVRTGAGSGAQTLIAGFVVGGTGSKQVLVRAIGPTLGVFGVTGVLADPRLGLYSGPTETAANSGWGGGATLSNAFAAVGAFALPVSPAISRDAALLSPLGAGAYSAQVTSASGGTGVALVEAYDADGANSATRFINLSARTLAGTGAQTLIAGFVLSGNVPRTLLIRGIGPTLGAFGVAGVLANPRLELRNAASAVVATNAGWAGTPALAAAFTQVGAFPLPGNSGDAALLLSLVPGSYTAQVAGVGGATGVALVEVYEVP